MNPTRRQQVLSFIVDFTAANGHSPTYREIAEGCGLRSTSAVWHHVHLLEAIGVLSRKKGKPRSIHAIDTSSH